MLCTNLQHDEPFFFKKKSVKFNLKFMYKIHRKLHLPDNFECRTTYNLTFKWIGWYLNFSACFIKKINSTAIDKITRLWKIHHFPNICIFWRLHAQNIGKTRETEVFKCVTYCSLSIARQHKLRPTSASGCVQWWIKASLLVTFISNFTKLQY